MHVNAHTEDVKRKRQGWRCGCVVNQRGKAGPGESDSRCQDKQQSVVRYGEIQQGVAMDHNAGVGVEGQTLDGSDI